DNQSPSPSAASPSPAPIGEPPPKVRELLDLMADPQVRSWLDQRKAAPGPTAEPERTETPAQHGDPIGLKEVMVRLAQIQAHFRSVFAALPHVIEDFRLAGGMLANEMKKQDLWQTLRLVVLFLGLGYGIEWLFKRATSRFGARFDEMTHDT